MLELGNILKANNGAPAITMSYSRTGDSGKKPDNKKTSAAENLSDGQSDNAQGSIEYSDAVASKAHQLPDIAAAIDNKASEMTQKTADNNYSQIARQIADTATFIYEKISGLREWVQERGGDDYSQIARQIADTAAIIYEKINGLREWVQERGEDDYPQTADMIASTAAAIEEKLKKMRESAQRAGSSDYSRILDTVVNTNSAITDKLNKIKEWTQKAASDNSQEKPAQALGFVIDIAV